MNVRTTIALVTGLAASLAGIAPSPAQAAERLPGAEAGLRNCTRQAPITCDLDVPPGQYELRLSLGSRTAAAETGVQVEARRVAIAPVATAAGELATRSVTVDVRVPESMPTGEEGPGTDGLQVVLTGAAPALSGIEVVPAESRPRLLIASDSTAADWLAGPKRGWGQALPQLFDAGVVVANHADSGESTGSWLSDPTLFETLAPRIRPGDEVLIQLAHNDKQVTEDVYRANLRALVEGVRDRGGLAVLVTPPCRALFAADGTITPTGRVVNSVGVDLPAVIRSVAQELHTPLLDLTAESQALLEQMGPVAALDLYAESTDGSGRKDRTHFNEHGATVLAGLVADEIRAAGLPVAANLR